MSAYKRTEGDRLQLDMVRPDINSASVLSCLHTALACRWFWLVFPACTFAECSQNKMVSDMSFTRWFTFKLKPQEAVCCCCHAKGPTRPLPFLGSRKFCTECINEILKED